MSEMIERVARAIALAALDDETRSVVDPENWPVAESYCDMARAAIEAMREPLLHMIEAGDDLIPVARCTETYQIARGSKGHPEDIYRAMIDAALSERP